MTRITLEVDGITCIVSGEDHSELTNLLVLIEQAIRGVGFYPPEHSTLEFVEEYE